MTDNNDYVPAAPKQHDLKAELAKLLIQQQAGIELNDTAMSALTGMAIVDLDGDKPALRFRDPKTGLARLNDQADPITTKEVMAELGIGQSAGSVPGGVVARPSKWTQQMISDHIRIHGHADYRNLVAEEARLAANAKFGG